MICRNCGTEIADKAIVCYRCGTGTMEPVRKAVEIRPRRSPIVPILVVLVLAILAFLAEHYHVLGLSIQVDVLSSPSVVLIDFPPFHA